MNEVKQIRIIQLAASLLLRMNDQIKITQANSVLYDIAIETPVDNAVCLVKVVDDEFLKEDEWLKYMEIIHSAKAQDHLGNKPLLLLKLNETELALDFHFLGWDDWGEYNIEEQIEFHRLTQDNIKLLFDEIRKYYHVIRILDVDKVKVVKHVVLNQDVYGHQVPAEIVYFRDFKEDYKMNSQEPANEEERREKEQNVHLQREYPNDILDEGILAAVRTRHPEADMRNSLLVTNTEYRKWASIQKRCKHEEAEIRIMPDLGGLPIELLARLGTIEALRFWVDIYFQPAHVDHLYDNEGYDLRLPLEGWVDTLNRYAEVLKTLHRVKDLV